MIRFQIKNNNVQHQKNISKSTSVSNINLCYTMFMPTHNLSITNLSFPGQTTDIICSYVNEARLQPYEAEAMIHEAEAMRPRPCLRGHVYEAEV